MLNQTQDITKLRGCEVIDSSGDKIGTVDEIYLDQQTGKPEWLAVKTGFFGTNLSFVPLAEASNDGDAVRVPWEKSQVKDAPNVSADGQLSQTEEAELYRHYGLDYGEDRSDSGLPEGRYGEDGRRPGTDDAMTLSEEELTVGKVKEEAGRARLRKYVVTEEVQQTVPVQREEVRVGREPITGDNVDRAVDGPAISEDVRKERLDVDGDTKPRS